MRRKFFAVALDAFLHLLVDLPQRHAAGAFYLIGVGIGFGGVCHGRVNSGCVRPILIQMSARGKHANAFII